MKQIGIIVETEDHQVKPANLGVITLACQGDGNVFALVLEALDKKNQTLLADWGVDQVMELSFPDDPRVVENPVVVSQNLACAVKALSLDVVMGLSSGWGKQILPRVAALMDGPLVMDCMGVNLEKNQAIAPHYSGKTLATVEMTGARIFFGIRPNAVEPVPAERPLAYTRQDVDPTVPENFDVIIQQARGKRGSQKVNLAEAAVIVSGGRGMKSEENFSILFDCAGKLNAAVGASRVAVDSGWIPYAHQVGQTGEKVSPQVYIACGISGSIQHFAGMKTAKMIIAINSDENAAIVSNCDYYVIGDVMEIVPELTRQLNGE